MCHTDVQQLLLSVYMWLLTHAEILLRCVFAGSSLEVKIETDINDAVEIKTEADSNDIADYPCDDGPSIGMCGLWSMYIP